MRTLRRRMGKAQNRDGADAARSIAHRLLRNRGTFGCRTIERSFLDDGACSSRLPERRPASVVITPIILCGGSGTRLWPASRQARPKQFLALVDGRSTYQETLKRVAAEGFARPIVVTGHQHRFLAAEQAREIDVDVDILLEPEPRDSGPAFAAAAAHLAARGGEEAIGLALAADHFVRDAEGFRRTCRAGIAAAMDRRIVTFGVTPTAPSTDFGYIAPGAPLAAADGVRHVERFVEKPDRETADAFVAEGYLWNSGNFLCRADLLLAEYARRDPKTVDAARRSVAEARRDLDFLRLDADAFRETAALSIDHAVIEHTDRAAVVPAGFDWSDVGSWDALGAVLLQDDAGNAHRGDLLAHRAGGNVVLSDGPLVALAGVDDLAVVVTDDAVLVTRRAAQHLMRDLVDKVRESHAPLTVEHRKSFRPWGSYRSLDSGTRHQVKQIIVKPNARLSLQHHYHRAEHWIVVRGTARVTVDGTERLLRENEGIYIPAGAVHRMENPGQIDLEIIEVQTGSYLGEDDIVRHEDLYART